MNSSSSLDDLEVYPLDEDLFWKGQGRPVGCGEVVAPLDLCWGLHSERGPIYEDMDEEDVEEEDADKANDFVSPAPVVGRSIRRLENIAVKDGMVNVIVFDATVSIGAAGQGDLIDFKADLKEPLKRSGSLFRRNRHKRRVR